jgi:hypothetical protein
MDPVVIGRRSRGPEPGYDCLETGGFSMISWAGVDKTPRDFARATASSAFVPLPVLEEGHGEFLAGGLDVSRAICSA